MSEIEESVNWDAFVEQTKKNVNEELQKLKATNKSVSSREHHSRLESRFQGIPTTHRPRRNLQMRSGNADLSVVDELYQDIEDLVQQRRVTNVLTSPVRRQALEVSLADSFSRLSRRHANQGVSGRFRSRPHRASSSQFVPVASSDPSGQVAPPLNDDTAPAQSQPAPVQGGSSAQPASRGRQSQYPVPTRDQSRIVSSLRESPSVRLLSADQREAIIGDVSNLLQRGLVRNTLAGELRGHLEIHMQERADSMRRGQTVEEAVRSLERRRRRPGSSRMPTVSPSSQRRGYRMPQRDQSQILSVLRNSPALNSLSPDERDRIISDVGGLIRQRLVTNALSGQFRGVLELHFQQRAEQLQNGARGDSLEQAQARRRARMANNAAVRPHPAAGPQPAPTEHTAAGSISRSDYHNLRQELSDLRSQLSSMQQLLRSSFDLQLDIQRSIRQEVSSTMHAAFGYNMGLQMAPSYPSQPMQPPAGSIFSLAQNVPPASAVSQSAPTVPLNVATGGEGRSNPAPVVATSPSSLAANQEESPPQPQTAPLQSGGHLPPGAPVQNQPPQYRQPAHVSQPSPIVSPGHCVICLQAEVDCALYRCGHMCVDMRCALELKAQSLKCPICRAPIVDVVRTYTSS